MKAERTRQLIATTRVVAIIRTHSRSLAEETAWAIAEGGLCVVEVSFTTPGALDVVRELAKNPEVCAGAGTLMTVNQVHEVADAGASFIVTPHLDRDIIRAAKQRGLVVGPGVFTATECAIALSEGADYLKLFPAFQASIKGMKALMDPFPEASWLPTGGVSIDNATDWLEAGATAVGVGSELTGHGAEKARMRAQELSSRIDAMSAKAPPERTEK